MNSDAAVASHIQARLDRAVSDLIRGDAHAVVCDLFAPDAVYVRPDATLVGRDAIEAMFARLQGRVVEGWIRTTSLTVHGDLAYEIGTNSITTAHADGSSSVSNGRYLSVWRREPDGGWLIVADAPMAES